MMAIPAQRSAGMTVSQALLSTVTSISVHPSPKGATALMPLAGLLVNRLVNCRLSLAIPDLSKLQNAGLPPAELLTPARTLVDPMGFGLSGLPKAC